MSFKNFGFDKQLPEQSAKSKDSDTSVSMSSQESTESEFYLSWNDLSYSVDSGFDIFKRSKVTKQILKPQTGFIKSGSMTALMGPSGAGKTSLLNCISSRITTGVTGKINYLSKSKDEQFNISFVLQQDHLFPELSVRETIFLAARFKLPHLNDEQKMKRVIKIATDLNLDQCLGNKVSNCSGGQIKRTSIAVDIISPPSVLIFDEPTSGLDSTTAFTTIQVIQSILDNCDNIAIVCAIHQPSYEIFSLFDQIYLLSQNGRNIYFDSPKNVTSYLNSLNIHVAEFCNPASYLLDTAFEDNIAQPIENMKLDDVLDQNMNQITSSKNISPIMNFWQTTYYLFCRNWILLCKNPTQIYLRVIIGLITITTPIIAFNHQVGLSDGCWNTILGNAFDDSKNKSLINVISSFSESSSSNSKYLDNLKYVSNNFSFIIFLVSVIVQLNLMITAIMIPGESKVVKKELSNNWYFIDSYILAKILFIVPLAAMQIMISVIVLFMLTGQYFTLFTLCLILFTLTLLAVITEITGMIFGLIFSDNLLFAIGSAVTYNSFILFFGGFFTFDSTTTLFAFIIMMFMHTNHVRKIFTIAIYGYDRCDSNADNSYSYQDLTSPMNMIEKFFNLITFQDSRLISPIIGLPDDFCVAQVINATRDYLGINEMYDIEDVENVDDDEITLSSSFSYSLSLWGLEDSDVRVSLSCIIVILITYLAITFFVARKFFFKNK